MALKGDLASVDLAQVFQMLALNQKVGLLYIQSPTSWKALYFDERGVTLYFNEHTTLDRVLAKLIRSGMLAADGVAEAREHAAQRGQSAVDSMLAGGYLSEDELDAGIRNEIEEEIYEIFFWYDAKFEFFEGATEYEGKEGTVHDSFFFGTDMLIMEAARRIDEWGHIQSKVPNNLEIHRHVKGADGAYELDDDTFRVFELIDGKRNVDRLVEIVGMPTFPVCKAVARLIDEGMIETVPATELIDAGIECTHEGRMQDAINLFERASTEGEGVPEVHTLASEAYDAIGEYELSTYHTKCSAEHHAASGQLREAIRMFRWVLESVPTDLEACQRVVELSVGHPELSTQDFDPLKVGKDLVDLYLEIGEVDRVRRLLEELIRQHPTDIELKKSLINVHTKAGDTKRVVELYESIADDLTKQGTPIQAIKYLQKILQLNRARTDISERIKRLYQVDERRRSRRRSLVALGMIFCLLVLGSIGYYFYNEAARRQFDRINLTPLVERKDFAAAKQVVESFIKAYPFTLAAKDAKQELVSLDAQDQAHQAHVDRIFAKKVARLKRIRGEYESAWKRHDFHFEHNDLDKALREIERVRQLVQEAGRPKDLQWAAAKNVEKSYRELRIYLSEASALERKARKAIDEGRWREGRRLMLDLIEDYGMASQAKLARVPVKFDTSPSGAEIYFEGKPVTRDVGGQLQVVKTPAVVFCPNQPSFILELRKTGFESVQVDVNPRRTELATYVMNALPSATFKFAQPAQTTPGVSPDGNVVAGLTGGYLGIVRKARKGDPSLVSMKLPGLSEVGWSPTVTRTHAFFATNVGELLAFDLHGQNRTWRYKIEVPLKYDPMVANSRIYLVDRDSRLICVSAHNGSKLWEVKLDGLASGVPYVFGNRVAVGSQGGSVRVLDTARRGTATTSLDLKLAVSSRVMINGGFVVFGTADGKLHGYRRVSGQRVWSRDVGRGIRSDEICMAEDNRAVFVVGDENTLMKIRISNGSVLLEKKMRFRVLPGMITVNGDLLVVVEATEKLGQGRIRRWHRLEAFDPNTFEMQWKFSDGGKFRGRPATDGKRVYLTGSKGEVYRFQ